MARQGVRIDWSDVPPSFRDEVNQFLGTEVIETTTLDGGFSPGPAVRARLHDGSTVFIKAAGAALNEVTTFMHRREAKVLSALPDSVPAPRLLGVVDDGDWVALVVEWVDGHTPDAADPGDLQRLLSLLERVADVTPATELTGVGSVDRSAFEVSGHWLHLAANPIPASTTGAGDTSTAWPSSTLSRRAPPPAHTCCTSTCAPTTSCSPRPDLVTTCWSTGPVLRWALPGSIW